MKPDCTTLLRALLLMLFSLALAACSQEDIVETLDPVAFHSDDSCHVCGMVIMDFPGPKGQAVAREEVRKFCSTSELLSWHLQPENRIRQARLYVHDMGRSQWDHPADSHLIDATHAWYVAGSSLSSAMGAPLASFADKQAAEALAAQHEGAQVLSFEEIDQEFLQRAAAQHGGMGHGHGHGHAHPHEHEHADQHGHESH